MPTANLRITTIQSVLHWENVQANLDMFSKKLAPLAGHTDLIVLPEMFTTGFTMHAAAFAEPMDGPALHWLAAAAAASDAVVTGSIIIRENEHFFNRLVWMQPNGQYRTYDKHHLFTPAGEHKVYRAGEKKLTVEWKGWKVCPLVCYDLRFPVWARNVEDYDLLLFAANWPQQRSHHWNSLLVARAIENQAFVVGVNRVGTDGNGVTYTGGTSVTDYSGMVLYRKEGENAEEIFSVELNAEKLLSYRENLQFLADKDEFEIFIR